MFGNSSIDLGKNVFLEKFEHFQIEKTGSSQAEESERNHRLAIDRVHVLEEQLRVNISLAGEYTIH